MSAFVAAAATILTVAIVAPGVARANTFEEVQGAWAVEDMTCSDVFASEHNMLTLKKRQDDTLPGFIIDGRAVHGAAAACRIIAFKPSGDGGSVLLSCASQMSVQNLKLTVKLPDPNTLIQFDPDFPDLTTRFHRCK